MTTKVETKNDKEKSNNNISNSNTCLSNTTNPSTPIKSKYTPNLEVADFLPDAQALIKDYICYLCGGVYFNPRIDRCGHIYCTPCLKITDCCPLTNAIYNDSNLTPINFVSAIIDKQMVYCRNKSKGCEWTGKLIELSEHQSICPKQSIKCDIPGCIEGDLRENISKHQENCEYRVVPCVDCQLTFPKILLENHFKECPEGKLECPKNCNEKIKRKDLEKHVKDECENISVYCEFETIGCLDKFNRKYFEKHMIDNHSKHNLLAIKKIADFQKDSQKQITELSERLKISEKNNEDLNSLINEMSTGKY